MPKQSLPCEAQLLQPFPAYAAANPSETIATENIQTTWPNDQSSPDDVTTPKIFTRAGLNMLHT